MFDEIGTSEQQDIVTRASELKYINCGRGYNRCLKPAEEIKHEKVYHKKTNGRAGSIPKNDLNLAGKTRRNMDAMRSEGKNIQQEQSYVVGDAIYCVYNADSEELIKSILRDQAHLPQKYQKCPGN